MTDLKHKLEALLFSSGRRMSIEELSLITRKPQDEVQSTLEELKKAYENNPSIILINEGIYWKLTIHDQHLDLVKGIVTQTELSKTLMETLAVIAFKYPIKQSELIRIRTNKAYDHLRELEDMGYITRQKYSRTKLIKLTQKFFDYFDLPREKLKESFKDFEGIAKAIEEKEGEIKQIKEDQKTKAKEAGKPEVDLIDDKGHKKKLETFDLPKEEVEQEEAKDVELVKDQLGNLDIVDEPEEQPIEQEGPEIKDEIDELAEEIINPKPSHSSDEEEQSTETPEEEQLIEAKAHEIEDEIEEKADEIMGLSKTKESDVDKRIDEILPEKESSKEDKDETPS